MFIIYGKDTNQKIDSEHVITSVSVIKDFDTKKTIFSTPAEAQENILDIETKSSELYSKWQSDNIENTAMTTEDMVEIKNKITNLNDLPGLDELFNRSGKKIVTTSKATDEIFKLAMAMFFKKDNVNFIEKRDLKSLKKDNTHPVIEDICSNAFKKTINNINGAMRNIENSEERLNDYIINILGISHVDARNKVISSLKSKLQRMKIIFDENRQDNIFILMKKELSETQEKTPSKIKQDMVGFALSSDPLDRIFINTAMILDFPIAKGDQASGSQLEAPPMAQPHSPRRNRLYFINMIADTMLHEATHVLGSPEDYLYLRTDETGRIVDMSSSINKIDFAISHGQMIQKSFEYLSKIYFISNPVYKGFSMESLIHPTILSNIFRNDNFFRAIVLLNNPDTISLLIRELANSNLLD